jgi:N-acyl homoserine lactone hydrolase
MGKIVSGSITFRSATFYKSIAVRILAISTGLFIWALTFACTNTLEASPPKVNSLRVYVMNCGLLTRGDPMLRFGLTTEQVGGLTDLADPCYLIVHPQGTILWDTGMVPDRFVKPGGNATIFVDSNSAPGSANWTADHPNNTPAETLGPTIIFRSLKDQLAEIGYTPADITYLILSHSHIDHVANSNDYAGSTWIVQKAEREFMFSDGARKTSWFPNYSKLEQAKTVVIEGDHDVFGDGSVILKFTPGHTPGHQSLFLRLKETGPLVISGDLYHYEAGRELNIVPPNRDDVEQTKASRARMEKFIAETRATLWIQHSLWRFRQLKLSPAFYD